MQQTSNAAKRLVKDLAKINLESESGNGGINASPQ
jgi:hypothetical protein